MNSQSPIANRKDSHSVQFPFHTSAKPEPPLSIDHAAWWLQLLKNLCRSCVARLRSRFWIISCSTKLLRSAQLGESSSLLAGFICLGALLLRTSQISAAEPLVHPSKITLDPCGALVVDGQKVFPINLTIIPPSGSKTPGGKDAYEEFRDGGAMFMRTGGAHWDSKAIESEMTLQAAAAHAGLRCCPWLGWDLANIKEGDKKKEQQLRNIIERLKNSPGIGLWKGADEPEWGKKPPADVAHTARIIHEADPDHPIWLVQAPRGTVASLKLYDEGWDIGGIDIYPVSYPPGRHTEQPNKELSMVGDFTRVMREVAAQKPFWMTLQIAFSGTTPPKGIIRFPTFFEQRFMSYEAIIGGSRGLTYFGGGLLPTLNERDRKLGWNWTYWERVLKPLLREFVPGSPIAAALIAPDSKMQFKIAGEKSPHNQAVPDVSAIEYVVREVGGDIFVLACKKEGPTIQVRFSGLPPQCSEGLVLFEEPRKVEPKNGSFTDWFAPYDVHVYRFPTASASSP